MREGATSSHKKIKPATLDFSGSGKPVLQPLPSQQLERIALESVGTIVALTAGLGNMSGSVERSTLESRPAAGKESRFRSSLRWMEER